MVTCHTIARHTGFELNNIQRHRAAGSAAITYRVFVSGEIYGGKRFYDRGGLTGRRALAAITLGGQAHMFGEDGMHGPLEEVMLRPFLQGTLASTGLDVLPPFIGWHIPYISDEARREIMESWRKRIRSINADAPLQFPSLNDFDEKLRPLKAGKDSLTV
ncbi:NAD(P)H-dependent oxidoreductase [Parapusillimonas granuli]|uniref:NAD(P)H-dependent oxidoreductase n=1 Tax=Parapusillimonas granuli TaxID=380911 RepID=A0A853FTC6_9BURK|nr:hypothetical protein [Parapusillimonas granuli]NYT49164.1 NAD(P)H-dependent oxidoreductase [Parapusillimonas granuli]